MKKKVKKRNFKKDKPLLIFSIVILVIIAIFLIFYFYNTRDINVESLSFSDSNVLY